MASFGKVGDILRVRQGAGLIGDIVNEADGKILRKEYQKITIRFLRDNLVIGYEPSGDVVTRHFNVDRENGSIQNNPLELDPDDIVLTIEAPYAKHRVFQNGSAVGSADVTVRDKNNKSETVINLK